MAYVIENQEHPCHGKTCDQCTTCIFDVDIDDIQPKSKPMPSQCGQLVKCFTGYQCEDCEYKDFKEDKKMITPKETCNKCQDLIKNFIGDGRLVFNACCGRVTIDYGDYTRPRVIKYKTGQMLQIDTPDWCPKKNGISKQVLKPVASDSTMVDENEITKRLTPTTTQVNNHPSNEDDDYDDDEYNYNPTPTTQTKPLTYYEKKERLKKMPPHLSWDDIKEGDVYVIPKILTQARKVVRIVMKTDTMLRCSEINEFGEESKCCTSVYPSDIEMVFITNIHKY
jgi:hypothetical protein